MPWLCSIVSILHLSTQSCPELAILRTAETWTSHLPAMGCSHLKGGAQHPDTWQGRGRVQSKRHRIECPTARVGYVGKV